MVRVCDCIFANIHAECDMHTRREIADVVEDVLERHTREKGTIERRKRIEKKKSSKACPMLHFFSGSTYHY